MVNVMVIHMVIVHRLMNFVKKLNIDFRVILAKMRLHQRFKTSLSN